jgi:hypothetical protein
MGRITDGPTMVASRVSPKARKGISSDIAGRGALGADETRSAPLLRGPRYRPTSISRHCNFHRRNLTRGDSYAPQAASVFQQIGGVGNAYSRFRHLGADLTGLTDALRIEDGTQVCDQRTQVAGRESPP